MNALRASCARVARAAVAIALATGCACVPAGTAPDAPARTLSVCADPSSLPFSNERGEGFENRIASLVAADLHLAMTTTWSMQRRGFLRRTLNAGACDLVMGVPVGLEGLSTSLPYYTSTYAFVTLRSRGLHLHDFDDPALRGLTIGLQALGADGANTPPANSLALRGLADRVVGFPMWDLADVDSPPAAIVDAVAEGRIDTAVVWGPFAGYFAKRHGERLEVLPVSADPRLPAQAFAYAMAVGVRKGDDAFKAQVQAALDRHRDDIRAILQEYGVPLLPASPVETASARP